MMSISNSLEAREILFHLNDLGYRNITAEQLKEFMKDLKKLIKYEDRLNTLPTNNNNVRDDNSKFFDYLHKAATKSVEAKYAKEISPKRMTDAQGLMQNSFHLKRENSKGFIPNRERRLCHLEIADKENIPDVAVQNVIKEEPIYQPKSCSTSPKRRGDDDMPPCGKKRQETKPSKMWIRPRLGSANRTPRNCDPVELYQFYKKEWEKFKPYLPGENDHSELRWQIRNKLLGPKD